MPWKVSDAVKERTKFVLKWEERFKASVTNEQPADRSAPSKVRVRVTSTM